MPVLDSKLRASMVRMIYRCKPCKRAARLVYHATHETVTSCLPTGGQLRTESRTVGLDLVTEVPAPLTVERRGALSPVALRCPCLRYMTAETVRGRYSAAHKCGARCANALGSDCECECAGVHHGKAHGG